MAFLDKLQNLEFLYKVNIVNQQKTFLNNFDDDQYVLK